MKDHVRIMSKRPEFTIAQITEQFDVSRSTVRRAINNRRFPNATKDHHGRWMIPVDDVLHAGYKPRKTWLNEGSHDRGHEPGSQRGHDHGQGSQTLTDTSKQAVVTDLGQIENELAHERAQVDKLKALLEAERAHVESLRMALRMIEPGKPVPSEDPTPEPSSQEQTPTRNQSPQRPRKARLFQRLFKRL